MSNYTLGDNTIMPKAKVKEVKAKAIHKANIPVDKDGKSTETPVVRTLRILNGNDNATVDGVKVESSKGRWHAMLNSCESIETLFRSPYALPEEKKAKISAYLRSKADYLDSIGSGTTVGKVEDC